MAEKRAHAESAPNTGWHRDEIAPADVSNDISEGAFFICPSYELMNY